MHRADWLARHLRHGVGPYQLVSGDTLSVLASRFATSIGAILMANPNLAPTDFTVGRIICLPEGATIPG